ncbi:FAD-dependent oxidoreductase [Deferrisoma camini]|uniref:FAD-dependent oxidoreductase n=1 Tax=Deferrisoma camini TaxID=1035120 RepID=UPI0004BAF275|nr:FAD-dependent oxidoreductase [Deferrisoma camini]
MSRAFRPEIDPARCGACRVCEGACPASVLETLGADPDWTCSPRWARAGADGAAPCRAACPLGQHPGVYAEALARGDMAAALAEVFGPNPLPGVSGHLCHRPCEAACVAEPRVPARRLKEAVARLARSRPGALLPWLPEGPPPEGPRVAVVGAGPAGLAAARDLALAGCRVTLVDAAEAAGGMLVQTIPPFRLPREVVEADLAPILRLCAEVRLGTRVRDPGDWEGLRARHDAVVLALGAGRGLGLDLPGWGGDRCLDALSFLRAFCNGRPPDLTGRVVVVGGGNVAVDAARAAGRAGADEVVLVYRRGEAQMPADPDEVAEARAEGVSFRFLRMPEALEPRGEGVLLRLRETLPAGRGEPVVAGPEVEDLEAGWVLAAVGQAPEHPFLPSSCLDARGRVQGGPGGEVPGLPGVFAAGDGATGPGYLTEALASGRRAARAVAKSLGLEPWDPTRVSGAPEGDVPPDLREEARTCLRTVGCTECSVCRHLCPDLAITRDGQGRVSIDLDWCKGCGICAAFCPRGAVRMVAEG